MRIRLSVLFLSAVVSLLPAAFSGEKDVVRIGVCLSLSGEFQEYGRIGMSGVNIFLEERKEREGVSGPEIRLIVRDDKSDPALAAAMVRELAQEGVQAIIGPSVTGMAPGMIEVAREHKIVLISPTVTSPLYGKRDDWFFKVMPDDHSQGVALANFFSKGMEYRTAAVALNGNFDYGLASLESFRKTFTENGGQVLADERYSWDMNPDAPPDFSALVKKLKALAPEVVLLPGYAEDAALIVREAEKQGYFPTFAGGEAWMNLKALEAAGEAMDDCYYVGGFDINAVSPQAKRFILFYDRSADPHSEPSSVNGYDCMLLLEEGMRRGGNTGEGIRDALFRLKNFPLVSGKISFNPTLGSDKTIYIHRLFHSGMHLMTEVAAEWMPER